MADTKISDLTELTELADTDELVAVDTSASETKRVPATAVLRDATAFATAAQGGLADTATQPGDLGTAAAADTGDFATAAQGSTADTAVQPASTDTLTNKTITDFSNTVAADEVHVQVYNDSGVFMGAGTPVYLTGYNFIGTAAPTVAPADASSSATMPCVGITNETIGDGNFGEVVISGFLNAVNTSAFSEGDVLYVSETAGELTATPPVPDGTNLKQAVAVVLSSAGSGKLQVLSYGVEVAASPTAIGMVELATIAEVDTGTDEIRAITPAGLAGSALQSTADSALQPGDIGSSVQGFDADTLKADTADTLTAGFDSSDYAAGTKSSGTYTPAASDGNFQVATNGGAHTLAPPSTSCSIVVHYTNNGTAGAITTSGFTAVTGDSFTTTDTHEFVCVVTKINDVSVLNVTALQ